MMGSQVLAGLKVRDRRPSALDVGCGPGLVMGLLSPFFELHGLDTNREMVRMAIERGFVAEQADALALPFDDGSFDVVYCSFTLLWVGDPQKAIHEMARVARRSVVLLAEPDYGGRICVPREVADLDRYLIESLVAEGADPFVGRKLGMLLVKADLHIEVGVHSGAWSPDQLGDEADAEWNTIADAVRSKIDQETFDRARIAWDKALTDRSLFLFNPVFYAIGTK